MDLIDQLEFELEKLPNDRKEELLNDLKDAEVITKELYVLLKEEHLS